MVPELPQCSVADGRRSVSPRPRTVTPAAARTGPIATPTLASIDAALHPDTADKFIYFLAIPDDSGKHVFAKTAKQHEANKKKYGYT